jgi:hypothetical protein
MDVQRVSDRARQGCNAARNIELRGLAVLPLEFSAAGEAKAVEAAVNEAPQGAGVGYDPMDAGIIAPSGR